MLTIIVKPTLTNEKAVKFQSDDPAVFAECVARLKEIPACFRRYDPAGRQWYVHLDAEWELNDFLSYMRAAHQAYVRRDNDPKNSQGAYKSPRPQPAQDAFAALHLLPSAPPEVVKAAYRALAQLHHPDKGGDTATMQRLNDAYRSLAA